ncbi:peptide ABC transporter substrate-binding protein [Peribacillus cavernae]|uniref:Peptide ABC transporter substrate-binding protein n=1 Tax=Peribacillus cavernae TaxID=1674310 RepID=A0A3S0UH57_9BACI|nr:peptide ABC transporter substrate-binding protein [Peribacillus cavernae]MDQ0218576.1 oligopeptide transport system substrate-binding protein [Peribacillus cavernae]RUQ31565.1 peptide ABC transporter substrate-binding protein [Peribacillus cavernae]
MNKQLNKKVLLVMAMVVLVLTGCNFDSAKETDSNSNKNKETSEGKQVLNMVEASEIPTMDSAHAHDNVSFTVLSNVNEGLYRLGKEHKPELAMASDDQISEDGLVHTFTLRDANWSNGEPVTAADFVYAWQRVFKETGHYASMFETASILNATEILEGKKPVEELGVKALDEKTLEVTLAKPAPLLGQLLTFPTFLPQNQKFVESQGKKYALEASNVIYNGPFMLSEWKHDTSWKYKKNPDYWDADNVTLAEINVFVVKEAATQLNLYETKEVDSINLSSASVDQYQDNKDFMSIADSEIFFLRFNHNHKALGNENIRRAIDMSWDKKAHVETILNNGSLPLYGLVPKDFSSSPDGKGFRELNGDFNHGTIKEAQKYLAKGLEEIGQDSVKVTLTVSAVEGNDKTAEYLKSQIEKNLPELSVDIKLVPVEQRYELESAKEYDMVISAWGPDYIDPMTYIGMWVTDGSANRMDYSNTDYDALVEKINNENDPAKRYQMMLDAEKMLFEDAAIAPLYQRGLAVLQRSNIKGLVRHPSGPDFSFKWTRIEGK